jgi:hypothetical protein
MRAPSPHQIAIICTAVQQALCISQNRAQAPAAPKTQPCPCTQLSNAQPTNSLRNQCSPHPLPVRGQCGDTCVCMHAHTALCYTFLSHCLPVQLLLILLILIPCIPLAPSAVPCS